MLNSGISSNRRARLMNETRIKKALIDSPVFDASDRLTTASLTTCWVGETLFTVSILVVTKTIIVIYLAPGDAEAP